MALDVLENVAVLLKSERLEAELLGRATRYATARTRWRYVDNDPHPLELGLDVWATIFRHHERLRRQLQADERQAALAVLRDAEAGCLATRYHSEQDEEDAMFLAKELGVQAPVFGGS
ncbi:MAG: hypothetical protein ABI658_11900 [Acidimicrobiales bacterium]